MIRDVSLDDAIAICEIFNHYIQHTTISFEETPVSEPQMRRRITEVTQAYPWLVSIEDGSLQGYAFISRWRKQAAYRRAAECTIYLRPEKTGKGIGQMLFAELLERVKKTSIHVLVSGIALPNEPSIRLHEKFGFEQAALFKQAGCKFGRWIDVGYWQLLLKS